MFHLEQQDWICQNLSAMGNQSTNYLTDFNFQQYLAFVNPKGTTNSFSLSTLRQLGFIKRVNKSRTTTVES